MINFDLTTLIVNVAVMAVFVILVRKLTRPGDSTSQKILIVFIMLLVGFMVFLLIFMIT